MSGPGRAASSFWALEFAARLALLWWLFAAVEIALSFAFEGTVLRTATLPAPLRRDLLARELAYLAVAVAVPGIAALAGLRLLPRAHRFLRWSWVALFGAVPIAFLLLSWTTFRSTGRFLGPASVGFLAMSPLQFFQHVAHIEPLLFAIVPAGFLAVVFVATTGVAAIARRLGRAPAISFTAVTAFAILGCVVFGERDSVDQEGFEPEAAVIDPDAGYMYTYGELYKLSRNERTGPLSYLISEVRQERNASREPPFADPLIPVTRRPIISLDEWRARAEATDYRRWNVIIAIVESLRPDQLRIFGGRREVMPNLEAIASSGRAFSDHYAQASHSNYADLCPLSGHYPLRSTEVHLYPKNPSYPRVPIYDLLDSLGWHTAVISSQNEIWGHMINFLQTGHIDHFFHSENYDGPTYVPRHDDGFSDFLKGSRRSGKIDDRFTVAEAIRWIDSNDDGAPFFIYLNLQNSHLPYETPADFPRRFGPETIDFAIRFGGFPYDKLDVVKDLYADSLAYSDFQIGKLIAHLREIGQWDRTLLVVTGDTGQAFYEHGTVAHAGAIWNEVMRVPLVIRAPGMTPAVDPRPAQQIDVPPTVLDLLGLPPHPGYQGRSLVGPYDGSDRSRFLIAQTPLAQQFGIVRGDFKLIYDLKLDQNNLFDLANDPHERRNVASTHRKRLEQYRTLLDTWRKHQIDYYRDPALHATTYPPVLPD